MASLKVSKVTFLTDRLIRDVSQLRTINAQRFEYIIRVQPLYRTVKAGDLVQVVL